MLDDSDIIVSGASSGDQHDRICSLLRCDSNKKVTVTALQRVLTDAYSPSSILLRDYLLKLVMSVPMSEAQQVEVLSAKALIRHFDGVYSTNAAAPVLLEAFRVVLISQFLRPFGSLSGLASSNGAGTGGGSDPVGRRVGGVSIRYGEPLWFSLICNSILVLLIVDYIFLFFVISHAERKSSGCWTPFSLLQRWLRLPPVPVKILAPVLPLSLWSLLWTQPVLLPSPTMRLPPLMMLRLRLFL